MFPPQTKLLFSENRLLARILPTVGLSWQIASVERRLNFSMSSFLGNCYIAQSPIQAAQGTGIYSLKDFPKMFFTCCCIGIWQESDEESQHYSLQLFSGWRIHTSWTLSSESQKTEYLLRLQYLKQASWPLCGDCDLTWLDKDKINKFLFSKWPLGTQCPCTKCCCKGHIFCPFSSQLMLTLVTISATWLVLKELSATTMILLRYNGKAIF